ncbi:AfsR/SARP family transcriptional regulator [Actinosynnema sp. CS-041913]|uniref:AfsR/SARP family transcriptional regulator n=1 Tax=Actinosynnema sp. CS-041913 TaxID=3239917 RepID=UPI003D8EBD62
MAVKFTILGGVEAWADGERIDLGHARQRCVLVVLLLEANQVVPTDRLVERVWGGSAPKSARSTLYSYLHRLRRSLPAADGATIARRSGGYALTVDPDSVDVHRFTALSERARAEPDGVRSLALLDEAVALWRGVAFDEVDSPWLSAVRSHLDRARLDVEVKRADQALDLGRFTELAATLPALAHAHPMDERLAAQLMLALHGSGRRVEALDHYRRFRGRLVGELGIEPGTRLRHVHRYVLAADTESLRPTVPLSAFTGRLDEADNWEPFRVAPR